MKQVALLLFCISVALKGYSQNNTYLYFSDALNLVYSQNKKLEANKYEQEALKFEKRAMGGLRSPQFHLGANYTIMSSSIGIDVNNLKAPVNGILSQLPSMPSLEPLIGQLMGADWSYTVQDNDFLVFGAGMVAPIYMGGKINAANNAAKIRIEEGQNKTDIDKDALFYELVERYFGLSLAQQVSQVRQDVVEGMQHHYNDAMALERNGIISKSERLYAEMYLDRAKADKQKSLRDVVSVNTALENTLNAEATYKPITNMFVLRTIEPVDYFINHAIAHSPILKQLDFKHRLAQEQVRAKRAAFLPTVSAIGAINIADYQLTNLIPNSMIGVTVDYKIFNGLKNVNEYKASKSTVKMVESMKDKAVLDMATLIEKNYNDLLSLSEQVSSYDATLNFAQEYLVAKQKAFKEGIVPSRDVVDAELNLAKSRTERMQLAYQYDIALAKLLELCGMTDQFGFYMVGINSKTVSY